MLGSWGCQRALQTVCQGCSCASRSNSRDAWFSGIVPADWTVCSLPGLAESEGFPVDFPCNPVCFRVFESKGDAALAASESCSIILAMRAVSIAMLVVGFGIGFGAMYSYISPKAADIARPIPQFVPQSASASAARVDPAIVKQLEDTLRSDPRNFSALRELGNIRYDERNFTDAAALYDRALEIQPDNVDIRADRGGALLQANRVDEAMGELKAALSQDPTHPQALFIYGVGLLEGKGDRDGAIAAWRKLIESHPDLPELELVKEQIQRVEDLKRRQ